MDACLNFMDDMSHGYTEGYRRAAERLIECAGSKHTERDYLVYPIIFLYRHHTELRLKRILNLLHDLGERDHPAPRSHDLSRLWSESKTGLEKFSGKGDKKWFSAVEGWISQIMAIDPASDAFRYPTSTRGEKSIADIKYINLAVLRDAMHDLLDWLEGATLALDHRRDMRSDLAG